MIGDGAEAVAARETGLDDVRERLAAVAPGRVHLEIAAVVLEAGPVKRVFRSAASHLRAAQKVLAQIAASFDVSGLCRSAIARSTVADVPVCSTSRMMRVDEGPMFAILRSVPSALKQRCDRLVERQNGRGRALVAPRALLSDSESPAKSRSSAAICPFMSMPELARAIN